MTEIGVVIDEDGLPLYWHAPPNRSSIALPDSRALWEILWRHRDHLWGFAHSHPGRGLPAPSHEDLTTFRAIDQALGRCLMWWIASIDQVIALQWDTVDGKYRRVIPWPPMIWLDELRRLSYKE